MDLPPPLLGIMLDWRLTLYLKVEPMALFNLYQHIDTNTPRNSEGHNDKGTNLEYINTNKLDKPYDISCVRFIKVENGDYNG